jgi:hypothetical protein
MNNSAGPATLHSAEGGGVTAYASHAVAAGLLAGLDLQVDTAAVPEFIALDFVGGERTLVAGVRVLPPASVADAAGVRPYWPDAERWRHVADAYEHTERSLLATLAERTMARALAWP